MVIVLTLQLLSTNSTVTLGIIVDGTLSEEVILTESINPYA